MNMIKFYDKGLKNLKWYDISLIKTSVMLFTLGALSLFPGLAAYLLAIDWYWYLLLLVVVAFCPMKRFFKNNPLF
ncbi:hypothetical protein C0585_03490 [Candidatus Woesearchaeota archaeon]|nr:MAG: hypothetical protein C0585_03490 [Candidatus Woesearchaeota archaeon]